MENPNEESAIGPSGLTPFIESSDEWKQEDIGAIIKAAEDQDETLKQLNKAYDIMWFALLNFEAWDNDEDHPFHEACDFISKWRSERYPHIWSTPDASIGEEDE